MRLILELLEATALTPPKASERLNSLSELARYWVDTMPKPNKSRFAQRKTRQTQKPRH
jgi:hypothetical protein